MAAERVFSLEEDDLARDAAGARSPCPRMSRTAGGAVCARCKEAPGRCRGRAGCSSGQQDALAAGPAATAVPCSMAGGQHSTHVSPASTVPLQPRTPRISALQRGAVGDLGFRHSPVPCGTMSGRRNVSHSEEEEPWTRTCLPLEPLALHGTFQGQPLSLNPPNYLCSCLLLGEPVGLG
ncbi:hypothetical protein GRJ2_001675200 [Grus japonensis]|uniref:Uncharacterized protein n=1 Tax=Grus japonensis TaxID=30415 RepID=A0ABC9X523_GRUJA